MRYGGGFMGLGRYIKPVFIGTVIFFIYLPIFVLVSFSFNRLAFPYRWAGFSWRWYGELFQSPEIWLAFQHSCIVASCATFLSLTMSLLFLFYGSRIKLGSFLPLFYTNLIIPEIIIAVGLLSLFTFLGVPRGLMTLIVAHTLLGLSFTVPILAARFQELEENVIEASLDLGATLNQTLFYVIFPLMRPALIAAGLLVFIISFDDYIIAFFCTSTTVQTLPLFIFAMIRTGVSPVVNALSTLLLVMSSIIVIIVSFAQWGRRIF
jgi:spermidine/putrescine transport system permease protein